MAIEKKLVFGNNARNKILQGILKCSSAVEKTFGPRGKLSVVYKGTIPYTTRDGVKTLQAISFKDELENIGASLIKEASTKANLINGDGSTTVAILTGAFCFAANRLVNKGLDTNEIVFGYKEALKDVINEIVKSSVSISGEEDIKKIAKVSAHGDEEVANIVTKAFTGLGENGVVAITDSLSRKGKSDVIFSTGCDFDRGFLSSLSVNTKSDTCELKEPIILILSKAVKSFTDIVPFIQYASENQKPIVILAPDFDDEAVAAFNNNLSKKVIEGALILAPGTSKQDVADKLRDIAVLTGAKILGEDVEIDGFKLKEDFGGCAQIVIHANKTELIDPDTDEELIEKYVEELKAKINKDDVDEAYSEFEIEKIKDRLAHMTGGVATIKVGAITQMELDEKKDRYDDAVNAVRAAMQEGIIPGGGTTLLEASLTLENHRKGLAYNAFLDAIQIPFKLLVASTGQTPEKIMVQILNKKAIGFNAASGEICDLVKEGIMDSLKVIKNDLIYAENIAETFLNIDVAIISDLPNINITSVDPILNQEEFFGGTQ
jgi:chaperonin GroEL